MGQRFTAAHHDSTHECAVTTVGARQGKAPCPYELRCTTSGEYCSSSSSNQCPDASTSDHGSSIHSSLKSLASRSRLGIRAASARCASEGGPPSAASTTSTPCAPSAAANSMVKVQTPPT